MYKKKKDNKEVKKSAQNHTALEQHVILMLIKFNCINDVIMIDYMVLAMNLVSSRHLYCRLIITMMI